MGFGRETLASIAVSPSTPEALVDLAFGAPDLPSDYPPNVFVIPAFNEEENLPRLIGDLESRPTLFPAGSRVLIVDDGSEDGTAAVVDRYDGALPLDLVRLGRNQGPGAAFRAGFAAALEGCPPEARIITLEADTTSDLDALPRMLERAATGAELVLASWVMLNVSPLRRVLSDGAGLFVRRALGLEAKTVSSFFRVYHASVLRKGFRHYGDDLIQEHGFACKAELLAKLTRIGARVAEVPVDLDTSRRIGKSKMPVLRTILAYWRMALRERGARGAASA
jgi:dolichol-phosphate mannosyltransferase